MILVISLKGRTTTVSGDGTSNNPYDWIKRLSKMDSFLYARKQKTKQEKT